MEKTYEKRIIEGNGKHKILILTLGVGQMVENNYPEEDRLNEIRRIVQNNINPYKKATYTFVSDTGTVDYEGEMFVAKPIMDQFKPDSVIIIGTVKSKWSQFLYRFKSSTSDEIELIEALQELDNMSLTHGIDTRGGELNNCQRVAEEILNQHIDRDMFPEIRILMARYGINKEQLQENYVRIRDVVSGALRNDCRNEIALDITHSFRSLPIFNLSVINYLRFIEDRKVEITNVFYGNFDVVREMPGRKAPIVDLGEITDLLNLSNGVSEFRKTGSVASLMDSLEAHDTLRGLLEDFNIAIQLNNFTGIHRAVRNLGYYFASGNQGRRSAIADVEYMLKAAIEKDILRNRPLEDFENIENDYIAQRDLRYLLALWMWDQGRYGQAACVGLESLRSILTPYYLIAKGAGVKVISCNNENNRMASLDRVSMIVKAWSSKKESLKKEEKQVYTILVDLRSRMTEAKIIRDRYAHILGTATGKTRTEADDVKTLAEFFEVLERLYNNILVDDTAFKTLYCNDHKRKRDLAVLVISMSETIEDVDQLIKIAEGPKKSPVYIIPEQLRRIIPGDASKASKEISYSAAMIRDYISTYFDASGEEPGIRVVFDSSIGTVYKTMFSVILSNFNSAIECDMIIDNTIHPLKAGETGLSFDETSLRKIKSSVVSTYTSALEIEPVRLEKQKQIETKTGQSNKKGTKKSAPGTGTAKSVNKTTAQKKQIGILITSAAESDDELIQRDYYQSVFRKILINDIMLMPEGLRNLMADAAGKEDAAAATADCIIAAAEYASKNYNPKGSYVLFDKGFSKAEIYTYTKIFGFYGFEFCYTCDAREIWRGSIIMEKGQKKKEIHDKSIRELIGDSKITFIKRQ